VFVAFFGNGVNESPVIFCSNSACDATGSNFGTAPLFNVTSNRAGFSPNQKSFVLLGRYTIQFGSLGVAYWLHGVADEGIFMPALR